MSNQQLFEIRKKFGLLYSEEYLLMAYNYKCVNNRNKCAKSLRKAWSSPSFDMNAFMQIQEISMASMSDGFNKRQRRIVDKGLANFAKNRPSITDSIQSVFIQMTERDQAVRAYIPIDKIDSTKHLEEMCKVDSINQDIFKSILKVYGFPGERLLPGDFGSVPTILIHSSYNESFYKEMRPVFLDEVRKGRMSPSYYLLWIDRHNVAEGTEQEFMTLDINLPPITNQLKTVLRQKRLAFGMLDVMPIPLNLISFE